MTSRALTPRTTATAGALVLAALLPLSGIEARLSQDSPQGTSNATIEIDLVPIGTYATGLFDESAAEIVAYDRQSQRLFVVNAFANAVDVLAISDPTTPTLLFSIDMSPYGAESNSVALGNAPLAGGGTQAVLAVACEAAVTQDPGQLVFLDVNGALVSQVTVGALPDMVAFTPNGIAALVANEGEPNDDYTVDPEGSISVVDLRGGVDALDQSAVRTADFRGFDASDLDEGIRIYGPGASIAQDLEPEFITISDDSRTAWVACQENNALAIVDVKDAVVTDLVAFGTKDHGAPGNELDASNRDDVVNLRNWPVYGLYQPDAIASFRAQGQTYVISANEGDSRDYDGFSEEERVQDLALDPTVFTDVTLQDEANLGRLKVTTVDGDEDGDGLYEALYSYGGRSFSIWTDAGDLVYDSGSLLEQITAAALPNDFNSTNDENGSFDDRSDDKGPEPEGVTVGRVGGRQFAFLGLERVGGILVFDLTDPTAPAFVNYVNNRDFNGDAAAGTAGDLGPEGLLFIPQGQSPISDPLLVVGNEVSGTVTIYQVVRG